MRKLIFIILYLNLISCQGRNTAGKENKISTFKIDLNTLPNSEKEFVKMADSISSDIDSKQHGNFQKFDTTIVENGVKNDLEYKVFTDPKTGVYKQDNIFWCYSGSDFEVYLLFLK